MADITITASTVITTSASVTPGTAGATITAGQAVYLDATDDRLKLADADDATESVAVGIALNGASAGQPIDYLTAGNITIGGTVVVGEVYNVSGTAGGIAPDADVLTGEYRTVLGVGISATVIKIAINASGVAIP